MEKIMILLNSHVILKTLIWVVILDTILGVLRAIKTHKFNSCVGIDGAIRKAAMILSVVFLAYIDTIADFDLLFLIPETYQQLLGLNGIGVHELFCILFITYEAVSILKNMTLCGLPVPKKVKTWIQKFLDDMTDELPETVTEELHTQEDRLNGRTDGISEEATERLHSKSS